MRKTQAGNRYPREGARIHGERRRQAARSHSSKGTLPLCRAMRNENTVMVEHPPGTLRDLAPRGPDGALDLPVLPPPFACLVPAQRVRNVAARDLPLDGEKKPALAARREPVRLSPDALSRPRTSTGRAGERLVPPRDRGTVLALHAWRGARNVGGRLLSRSRPSTPVVPTHDPPGRGLRSCGPAAPPAYTLAFR